MNQTPQSFEFNGETYYTVEAYARKIGVDFEDAIIEGCNVANKVKTKNGIENMSFEFSHYGSIGFFDPGKFYGKDFNCHRFYNERVLALAFYAFDKPKGQ